MQSCHTISDAAKDQRPRAGNRTIVLVGNPNVGKSVLFSRLTGAYVTVSNYPGTTVEVSRGLWRADGQKWQVIDTPGMYSFLPITEEERVARRLLLAERPEVVIHVVDAKNIERMLPLTLQLIEAGFCVVLDVNIVDEAERLGLHIDVDGLERHLGIPVAATAATSGRGLELLKEKIGQVTQTNSRPFAYEPRVESALDAITDLLEAEYAVSKHTVGLLLLQEDAEIIKLVAEQEGERHGSIRETADQLKGHYSHSLDYVLSVRRKAAARGIVAPYLSVGDGRGKILGETLSRLMIRPLTGIPILLAVLYVGLYLFVGVFGAGTLVDFLETSVFESHINPFVVRIFDRVVPWPPIRDLFVGEYGVITLGLRYAIAIILPIVGTFFLAFSVIEDSGYLPRLALLADRMFKRIGLSGRAVIPMVLGLGCDTMATIVTRTLETRRERVIATLLLALAIPCSAQLGVIFGILTARPLALLVWLAVLLTVFLLIGLLSARVLPGRKPSFYMELPPLRLPRPGNVLIKTVSRMQWYFLEIVPFFLLASVVIWGGQITGIFGALTRALEPLMGWLGLPEETSVIFIFGFFRRDYGAAGLYDLAQNNMLSGAQLVVAAVTLTLFIPCIAQFGIMLKERGWRTTLAMTLFIFPFAFFVGFLVHLLFSVLGAGL